MRRYTTARARKGSVAVGALFAFAAVVGGEVYRGNSVAGLAESPAHALSGIALALVAGLAAAAVALLLAAARKALDRASPLPAPPMLATRKAAVAIAAAMFLCWTPCLLAYWPGTFSYDIPTQTDYIASGHWTTQQPPLHTLIWALFLQLEGAAGLRAITWYALAQMAFLATSFTTVLSFLARRKVNFVLWALAFAFFAFNPVVALFAITPVKDAVLAGAFALVSTGVAGLVADSRGFARSKVRCAGFAFGVLACCLLRTNMLAALAATAAIAVAVLRDDRKAVALLMGTPLALALVIVGPVYSLAGIAPGSSAIASVPFQQVANVVRHHETELADDEVAVIDRVLPVDLLAERYNPRFADTVVRLFKGRESGAAAMSGQLADFAALWMRLVARYPLESLDAFLSLNAPYWYPFAQTPDPYSHRAYIETAVWRTTGNYEVELESKAPALHDAYERVADYSALGNPLCTAVFSPASAVWVLVMSFFLLYSSQSRHNALLAVAPLLFWLSFMAGPVSNMRYLFPLFCLYPLLACASLQPGRVMAKLVAR